MHIYLMIGAGLGIGSALVIFSAALGWAVAAWQIKRERKNSEVR